VAPALARVLADRTVADCAAKVAEEIASMNSADEVIKILLARLG
jgi:hypothetical protein